MKSLIKTLHEEFHYLVFNLHKRRYFCKVSNYNYCKIMTETNIWTNTVTDEVYIYSDLSPETTDSTVEGIITGEHKDEYKAVKFKDLRWSCKSTTDQSTTTYDHTVIQNGAPIKATSNKELTGLILETSTDTDNISGGQLLKSVDLDLKKRGLHEITKVVTDPLASSETFYICSRATGLWKLWWDTTLNPSSWNCEHIENSQPCCSCIADTYASTSSVKYYIATANNECYHSYFSQTSDNSITYVSASVFMKKEGAYMTYVYTLESQITFSSDFSTNPTTKLILTEQTGFGEQIVLNNYTRTITRAGSDDSTGYYKHIVYTDENGTTQLVMDIRKSDVNNSTVPYCVTFSYTKSGSAITLNVYPYRNDIPSISHGAIYRFQYSNDTWSSWTMPSYNSPLNRFPSVVNCAIGTNISVTDSYMYYFGCDDYSDYLYAWNFSADSTQKVSHGAEFPSSVGSWSTCTYSMFNNKETTATSTDDVWLFSTQKGVFAMAETTGSAYKYKTFSGVLYTGYSFCKIENNTYEYVYDKINESITGLYKLSMASQSEWYKSDNWTGTACTLQTISGGNISPTPCFNKVIDNEHLLFAITTDGSLFASSDGSTFSCIFNAPETNLQVINVFIKGDDIYYVATKSNTGILWVRLIKANAESLPTNVITDYMTCYVKNNDETSVINTSVISAEIGSSNNMIAVDNESVVASVNTVDVYAHYSVLVNGMIKSPTITDLYDKLALIADAMHISLASSS